MDPGFVHLHVHSSYSLLEGALTIARLAELAKKDRQPALALTDTDNMFGALEFSEKMAGSGIQPIVGCALGIDFGDQENRNAALEQSWPRVVLLAASEAGYRSLMRLCSRAYLEHFAAGAAAPQARLARRRDRRLDRAHRRPEWAARRGASPAARTRWRGTRCEALQRLFGDRLYIELQRHGMAAERLVEPALIELGYARGIPLVATNEPFFAAREDYEAHDALLVHRRGQAHRRRAIGGN